MSSKFNIPTLKDGSPLRYSTRSFLKLCDIVPEGLPKFWVVQETAGGKKRLSVEQQSFIEFLEFWGFRKLHEADGAVYVRVQNNVLSEVSLPEIKDFLIQFFDEVKKDVNPEDILVSEDFSLSVLEKYCYQNAGSIFAKEKMEMIRAYEGEMYQPGKFDNAFFFKDAWVKVTPEGMRLHDYTELPLNMATWKKSVIDFEIKSFPKQERDCQFQEFIRLITGKTKGREVETQEARKSQLEQAIGYLMHPFFEGALRAILITDVNSSGQKANGRTGKGLIATAIGKVISTAVVPAKRWKSDEKTNFTAVTKDSKLIVLDDLPANFRSEWVFNNITEGTVVKKMYKSEFLVMTKMLLLTNMMIQGEGSSTRGRFLEFEVENFFSHLYKPIDHFGNNFFSKHDWNDKEWAGFYWYMMSCSQKNLEVSRRGFDCGVEYIHSDSIEQKRLAQNLEEDFILFMDERCEVWFKNPTETFEIKGLKDAYLEDQNERFRKFSSQKMKSWVLEYCDFKKFHLELVSKGNNKVKYRILQSKPLL